MRAAGASVAKTSINLGLLLASCAAGLALCELSLRLFYPKYSDLAEAPFRPYESRIWARIPNSRSLFSHPDTRLAHALHHNNFALRQHRNFSAADLASATNVGVFGDSFVENIRMDAPYSFTEPLDWLLNQGPERFNVLNFGVDGYGPGQSFLHYESFRYAQDLDYVFFVYCDNNDLYNILETALFDLDDAGRLVRNEATRPPWWVRFVSRLHVSYLALDVSGRSFLSSPEASLLRERWRRRAASGVSRNGALEKSAAIFRRLARRWKHAVEENGGVFVAVLLPYYPPDSRITNLLQEENVKALDLYDCFRDHDDDHHRIPWRRSPYKFRRDYHWNENGNRLAAVCLYRFLEQEMRLSGVSEDALRETLHQYYSAFGGWTPPAPLPVAQGQGRGGKRGGEASPRTAAGIREKYQALGDPDLFKEYVRSLLKAPEKRIIRSVFDVYLDENRLVYVKDDCSETDMRARLFLKATSVDGRNFIDDVDQNLNFPLYLSMPRAAVIDGKLCAASKILPDYPVAHVVTGRFPEGEAPGWQAEAFIDRDAFRKALEKAAAPEKLVIRSDFFDVYLDGKWLTYVKDACSPTDLRRKFLLHVIPADERSLPDGMEFDDKDFHLSREGVHVDELGCVVRRRLPDYAVRRVRTGQLVPGGAIWEGEFSLSSTSR